MSGNNFESTEKKLCQSCGAEVTGNFCSNCGTKLEQEKKTEETKTEPANEEQKQEKEEKKCNCCYSRTWNKYICSVCGEKLQIFNKDTMSEEERSVLEKEQSAYNNKVLKEKFGATSQGCNEATSNDTITKCNAKQEVNKNKKSKKTYLICFSFAAAFVLFLCLAVNGVFCTHDRTIEHKDYKNAKCGEEKITEYVCLGCDKRWTEDTGEYGEHYYLITGEITEKGEKRECKYCGNVKYLSVKSDDKKVDNNGKENSRGTTENVKPNSKTTSKTIRAPRSLTDEEVCVCATDIVEKNMNNPSSARFCMFSEMDITRFDDNSYLVMGWVEGTNVYGATVRQTFLVNFTVTLNEHGKEIYTDADCTFM